MQLPNDDNQHNLQITPASIANGRTINGSIGSSSTVTFTAGSNIIRIYAKSQPVLLKWGSTAVTTSNFDEVIPANQVLDFVIPIESGTTRYTTCRVIEQAAGATVIIIEKT